MIDPVPHAAAAARAAGQAQALAAHGVANAGTSCLLAAAIYIMLPLQIVDTTCPWVSKVWNAVDNQARKQHTSVIHGKYAHEETIATASFATTYIIVKDLKEAQYLADYIMHGGSREEFLTKFQNALSAGFDPDTGELW